MHEILNKKHYRRAFYVIFAVLVILILILRYSVLPLFDQNLQAAIVPTIASFADKILTSLVVTVAVGSFIFWLTPDIMSRSQMEVIEPRSISDLLEQAMKRTDVWWLKGGCGRYFRSMTLPEIAKAARGSSSTREINVLILDPRNEKLCAAYATYRGSLRSAKGEKSWTVSRVRNELYATLICIQIATYEEPLLRINLGLINVFSSFRFDLSSEYVIVTKEDKYAPAMRCDKETFFYKSYLDEMVIAHKQSSKLPNVEKVPSRNELDQNLTKELLVQMGLGTTIEDSDITEVLSLVKKLENPYA